MKTSNLIPVEVSARHMHISVSDMKKLFGPDHNLAKYKDLSQEGEFAAREVVNAIGPSGRVLENIRVLGPAREKTQIELSRTDTFFLGIEAPLKLSGDLEGSAPIILRGPMGEVKMSGGVIVAKKHIHASPEDAKALGVADGDLVDVEIASDQRPLVFKKVPMRVKDKFNLALHLDTDEGNACWAEKGTMAKIINLN